MTTLEDFNSVNIDDKKSEINPCKGLFFRGSVTRCVTSHNGILERKELRLLKRKSCKGCSKCGWIMEYFHESDVCEDVDEDLLANVKHGKIYTPDIHDWRDWETGHIEIDHIDFVEVVE